MNSTFYRVGDVVRIGQEAFSLNDLLSVMPKYDKKNFEVHYYDGKKHYASDGWNQIGFPIPYDLAEEVFNRLPEMRMCRQQREIDDKYFEKLMHSRSQ